MTVIVGLQVEGVDLSDDATLEIIGIYLTDALWSSMDGAVFAELIDVPLSQAVNTAIDFVRKIENRLPQAKVLRVRRDYVSASDIAKRTGFSRETVRKWATSSRNFPAPVSTVSSAARPTRIWDWSEVAQWAIDTYAFGFERNWLDPQSIAHIEACLASVPDYASTRWQRVLDQHHTLHFEVSRPRRNIVLDSSVASTTLELRTSA